MGAARQKISHTLGLKQRKDVASSNPMHRSTQEIKPGAERRKNREQAAAGQEGKDFPTLQNGAITD